MPAFIASFVSKFKRRSKSSGDSYVARGIESTYEEFKRRMRERVFINCWHCDRDDSAAMWALHGKSDCAVALTTTVGRLSDALLERDLPYDLAIEKVEYIKHWRDPKIDIVPYARIFAYKTKAYQHEKEVRVLLDRSLGEFDDEILEAGMPISVDASRLLRSVVVAPEAPPWFEKLVRSAADKYKLDVRVNKSKLAADPV